jgi:hypothetical protein
MPFVPLLLALLGLVPFVICGLGALGLDPVLAGRMVNALNFYAALILCFLGAVHWGLALEGIPRAAARAHRTRYVLGVVPMLIAWVALLLPLMGGPPWSPLLLLLPAYIGVLLTERYATRRGLLPRGYMRVRWVATAGAVTVMAIVLVVRGLGHTIVL